MNIDQLRRELDEDEGCVYEIYLDHLGYPTFGIGHLVTKSDMEHGWSVGTDVDEYRVHEVFEEDVQTVLSDCKKTVSQLLRSSRGSAINHSKYDV